MLHYLYPVPMDYNHVNITELVYPGEQDHIELDITIIDDGYDDETIQEFYLKVMESIVVLTPRITVEIGCSKNAIIGILEQHEHTQPRFFLISTAYNN